MRRKLKNKKLPEPDIRFHSPKLARFINYVMLDGKRSTAEKIVYNAMDIVKKQTENPNPLEIFDLAIKNSSPLMEVRSRRVGGANYQVPREVRADRRLQLSMRWLLEGARKAKGKPMAQRLAHEIISASKGEGNAVKKREDTHRMAEANKAFAHFAW